MSFHSSAGRITVAGGVQAHHAVLLAADGNGGDVVEAAGLGDGVLEGGPPVVGVDLGAVGVGRAPLADQRAGAGVADHHFA